jgi:hypothetical protein
MEAVASSDQRADSHLPEMVRLLTLRRIPPHGTLGAASQKVFTRPPVESERGGNVMLSVQVLKSPYSFQSRRLEAFVAQVRKEMPDLPMEVIDLTDRKDLMEAHNLLYGPAILVNGRLDFIGIPSMAWFRQRLEKVESAAPTPEEASPKEPNTAPQ